MYGVSVLGRIRTRSSSKESNGTEKTLKETDREETKEGTKEKRGARDSGKKGKEQ